MKKAFIEKCFSSSFTDTRKYRYALRDENFFGGFRRVVIRRIERSKLGTAEAWNPDEWELVWASKWE